MNVEEIFDKHFPHDYYHANHDPKEKLIHDRECRRCKVDHFLTPIEEEIKSLLKATKQKEE
jgi:hypothetical protein